MRGVSFLDFELIRQKQLFHISKLSIVPSVCVCVRVCVCACVRCVTPNDHWILFPATIYIYHAPKKDYNPMITGFCFLLLFLYIMLRKRTKLGTTRNFELMNNNDVYT